MAGERNDNRDAAGVEAGLRESLKRELEGEILGWYDLGVKLQLPNLPLSGPTKADLVVVRGDGAAANPLQITVTPPKGAAEAPAAPALPK